MPVETQGNIFEDFDSLIENLLWYLWCNRASELFKSALNNNLNNISS
jgi:hypothetical protein